MKKILSVSALFLMTSTLAFAQDDAASTSSGGFVDFMLYLTYFMIIVAAIGAVVMSFVRPSGDKASLKRSLFTLGGVIVAFIVGFVLASDKVTPLYQKFGITAGVSKQVGAYLFATYTLLTAAVVLLVLVFIKGIIDWIGSLSSNK